MKTPYVSELEPNQLILGVFLVQHKEIRQKKTGEPYLSLTLADRTGDLDAKMWDNVPEVMDTFDRDCFLKVKGMVQLFQNKPQLTVYRLQRLMETEIDIADFLPASRRNDARFSHCTGSTREYRTARPREACRTPAGYKQGKKCSLCRNSR